MMSSRRFAGFGRLKAKLFAAAAVGNPPRVDSFAAVVYRFSMAAPSPVIHAGFMTLGAVNRVPPQLAGMTAGVLSVSGVAPVRTSVKLPAASAAVGNVCVSVELCKPAADPRNLFHSWPAKKNSLPFWRYGMGPPKSHPKSFK